ncbi:hypothetical protein RO07_13580 [Pandoraea pulmonicola]|uniref:Translocator protein BipB n=1 Tax=Pandoraea pulmonicola TaxID=93221 RepID=A0ABM5S0J5_PANPU|nr:hypothetical protein RO07_13580 [Pandoraea pulmonicola]
MVNAAQSQTVGSKREINQTRKLPLGDVVAELQARRNSSAAGLTGLAVPDERPELTPPTSEALKQAAPEEDEGPGAPRGGGKSGESVSLGDAGEAFEQKLTGTIRLQYLLDQLREAVDKNTEENLVSSLEQFKEKNKAQRAFHAKKSEEIQQKEAAARKAQEVMGCIGKIVGGIITGIAIGSALITGGASLALAGIGLGLMAADALAEKLTGESLTGRLLSPLIEKVFTPLAQLIGGAIADVLKKLDVDAELADTIGAVAGAVAAAVAVIAAAVVAKSLPIGKAIQAAIRPLTKSIGKMIPKLVSSASSKLSSAFASGMGKVNSAVSRTVTKLSGKVGITNAQVASLQASRVAIAGGAVESSARAGVTAYVGVTQNQVAQANAEITERLADNEVFHKTVQMAVDMWRQNQTWVEGLGNRATEALQAQDEANMEILGNTLHMRKAV